MAVGVKTTSRKSWFGRRWRVQTILCNRNSSRGLFSENWRCVWAAFSDPTRACGRGYQSCILAYVFTDHPYTPSGMVSRLMLPALVREEKRWEQIATTCHLIG